MTTPREYGATLALAAPPLTDQQVDDAARMLITNELEDVAA